MRKSLIVLILVLSIVLIGCSSGGVEKAPPVTTGGEEVNDGKNEIGDYVIEESSEMPIHPNDIMAEITILEPNSIGTIYMEATYTNNSKYPITSYSAKILLKDKNETTYLSTHNTVLPGEISPKFDSFGPETGDQEDYEILTLDVRARLDNGKTLSIEYDFKLDEAKWKEYDN